jgi:aminoglycoside phosphotransferase (APT) family kinase protein
MTGSFPSSFSHKAWSKKARSGQLEADVGFDRDLTLVHGDFHLDNIFAADDG